MCRSASGTGGRKAATDATEQEALSIRFTSRRSGVPAPFIKSAGSLDSKGRCGALGMAPTCPRAHSRHAKGPRVIWSNGQAAAAHDRCTHIRPDDYNSPPPPSALETGPVRFSTPEPRCNPHSSLAQSVQRPDRSPPPLTTGFVHGQHPMLG